MKDRPITSMFVSNTDLLPLSLADSACSMRSSLVCEEKLFMHGFCNMVLQFFSHASHVQATSFIASVLTCKNYLVGKHFSHRDILYIVSGTTPFRALLLVHLSQCLFERFFFHFCESRAMKGVIFFHF